MPEVRALGGIHATAASYLEWCDPTFVLFRITLTVFATPHKRTQVPLRRYSRSTEIALADDYTDCPISKSFVSTTMQAHPGCRGGAVCRTLQ